GGCAPPAVPGWQLRCGDLLLLVGTVVGGRYSPYPWRVSPRVAREWAAGAGPDRPEYGSFQQHLPGVGKSGTGLLWAPGRAARSGTDCRARFRDPPGPGGALDLVSFARAGGS